MRRSTLLVLLLFIAMAAAYYFLNNREQPTDLALTLTPEETVSYLFSSSDGTPSSIHIEAKTGEVIELARNAENAWALKLPLEASADQGSSEAAATQITTIAISGHLTNVSPKDVGLDAPDYKLIVKFSNNVERIAEIGVVTPTGNGYYVRSNGQIVIVSKSAIDALVSLLTNPPYAETLTPSPIPAIATETPLPPTPEPATATNESATPKP
ncbi:MAG: hypothetical protein ABI986_00890 [Chloroflexota bacterium]